MFVYPIKTLGILAVRKRIAFYLTSSESAEEKHRFDSPPSANVSVSYPDGYFPSLSREAHIKLETISTIKLRNPDDLQLGLVRCLRDPAPDTKAGV